MQTLGLKRFVTRPISWDSSKFQNLKASYLKNSKAFDNLSKRSQDQLTDRERGAISEKDVPQNLAEDSWTVSSKFK